MILSSAEVDVDVVTKSESVRSVARSVFTGEQFWVIKEAIEGGPPGQGGVVDGVEVDVQHGHGELAGGVVSQVQGGGEKHQVDGEAGLAGG